MLSYAINDQVLSLTGDLTYKTLNQLLQAEFNFKQLNSIDLSAVNNLDSVGLALLINWNVCHDISLSGMNTKMKMLVELYDLNEVLEAAIA